MRNAKHPLVTFIEQPLHDLLLKCARESGRSMAQIIRVAIEKELALPDPGRPAQQSEPRGEG